MSEESVRGAVDPETKESVALLSSEKEGARKTPSARPSKLVDTALLDATRASFALAAAPLALGFASATGRRDDALTLAEGDVLGAAASMRYARELGATLSTRAAATGRAKAARLSFADRLANPGLGIRFVGSVGALERSTATAGEPSIVFCDADASSILLNLVLREVFVLGRRPTAVVPDALFAGIEVALRPLLDAGVASVVRGGAPETARKAADAPASHLVAVCAPAARELIASSASGRTIEGFSSHGPSVMAIVPFLHGHDELVVLARSVATELAGPPGATRGVKLVLGAGWLQKRVFLDHLRLELRRRPADSRPEERARLAELADGLPSEMERDIAEGLVVDGHGSEAVQTSGLRVVTVVERGSDDPDELIETFGLDLRDAAAAKNEQHPIHLVSLFAHPMLVERPAFATALHRWSESVGSLVVGVGARASIAWSLGGPPVGPRDQRIQNGWMVEGVDAVVSEAPLRRSVASSPKRLERRARFEKDPSLASGALLGLRSLLLFF
jgi:hypothetical protein